MTRDVIVAGVGGMGSATAYQQTIWVPSLEVTSSMNSLLSCRVGSPYGSRGFMAVRVRRRGTARMSRHLSRILLAATSGYTV